MKRITATIILSLSISLSINTQSVSAAEPSSIREIPSVEYGKELVMPWRFYRRLSKCEVNLKVHAQSKSYTGMYGIARGTWQRWSNSSSAAGKTPIEQARVVDNIAWLGHTTDGVYKWPAGPWGWGAIKKNCMNLQDFICRSHHKAVQRWKRNCK
jgi:hypothetical protein